MTNSEVQAQLAAFEAEDRAFADFCVAKNKYDDFMAAITNHALHVCVECSAEANANDTYPSDDRTQRWYEIAFLTARDCVDQARDFYPHLYS